MKQSLAICCILLAVSSFSQDTLQEKKMNFAWSPEILTGILAPPNKDFVKHGAQTQVIVHFGWKHSNSTQEWAQRLKGPRTGLSVGYSNLGNKDSLGMALSLLSFIEFKAFRQERLKLRMSMGVSYFNKTFDSLVNPNNQGISTDLSWSFRSFLYYQISRGKKLDWHLGAGYAHHSNGHARLPNQGLNSFLISLSADIKMDEYLSSQPSLVTKPERSRYSYWSLRAGGGNHVLSRAFNDKKGVFTLAGETGMVLNNTFKLGVGFYYRYYEHYYDYITANEALVQDGEEFDFYKDYPWRYSSNFGVSSKAEVLLNHIGIEAQLGVNLHKPGYKIAWRITEGWNYLPRNFPPNAVLGEFNAKYKLKKTISTRLGLKYYLIGMNKAPKNNMFLAFHINSNLGQADFTEFSLGYVRSFNFK